MKDSDKNVLIVALGVVLTGFIWCLLYIVYSNTLHKHRSGDNVYPIEIVDSLKFKDSVLNYIFELRIEHPYIVYSQALIESGNFSSSVWRDNNNMFGMKMPERRPTLAIGINKGYSVYRTWRDGIVDYALFQSSYLKGLSEDEYFVKIGKSYAEDGSYEKKIREYKNQHKRTIR